MPKASKFSPDEGLTIYDLKDSEAVHYGNQSKGYVGKNFLKLPYSDGFTKTSRNVTFIVNNVTGEVTITGKNDGTGNSGFVLCNEFTLEQLGLEYGVDYTLTGCPQGGVANVSYALDFRERTGHNVDNPNAPLHRDLGSGVTFRLHENTTLVHIYIETFSNYDHNEVFRPMLRLASIADNTYEPYLTPNTEIDNKVSYADNTILGAKNIIPIGAGRDNSKSQNGVSWTLNADDTITGTTNGVASTGESRFLIAGYTPFTESLIKKNIAYKISAEVPSNAPNNVRFEIALWRDANTYDGVRYYQDKTSEETEFTITSATANGYLLYLLVPSGTTISSPITFKPMIRLASDTDKTYQSPTMTNRELTADVQNAVHWVDNNIIGAKNFLSFPYLDYIQNGNHTLGNVAITYYSDGKIKLNGTANAGFDIRLSPRAGIAEEKDNQLILDEGTYIASKRPNINGLHIYIGHKKEGVNSWEAIVEVNTTEEKIFSVSGAEEQRQIAINYHVDNGTVLNDVILEPMIRIASDTNNTYRPYAMTNRKLTQEIKYRAGDIITLNTLCGHISSGLTEIFVPINGKYDKSIKSIQITGTDTRIRGIKGYLKDDNAVDIAGVNFSDYLKVKNTAKYTDQIYVAIKTLSEGAFQNVDNNTPITISGNPLTITLS